MTENLESRRLLCDEQHGFSFRSKRSSLNNLLSCAELWTSWLDDNENFDILYLDFRKAFDTVPHQTLLSKLHSIGFSGNTLHWLSDFLSNRTQRVKINTTESEFSEVRSGVPQGSVLGPILFSIFVNDIFENMNASFGSLFADDAKIFTKVNTGEDGKKLQDQLDKADLWATSEQMEFNGEKCAVMHCGKKNPRCGYTLGGYKLKEVKHQ